MKNNIFEAIWSLLSILSIFYKQKQFLELIPSLAPQNSPKPKILHPLKVFCVKLNFNDKNSLHHKSSWNAKSLELISCFAH